MSNCVEKLPHKCGSGDGLQVFQQEDGSVDGYCFACGKHEPDPYEGGKVPKFEVKTEADKQAEVDAIARDYTTHGLLSRKLRKSTLEYFGIKMAVSQEDGETPVGVFFPYGRDGGLSAFKYRDLADKRRQFCIGKFKGCNMFGWGRAIRSGQRVLYITEGEYDAAALYQILKDGNADTPYADDNPAVVSVTSGAGSATRDVIRHKEEISRRFESVVLVLDTDEAGQRAVEEVCRVFPTARVATLPCKDANDCLLQGASKAARAAVLFRSVRPKNTRLVYGSSLSDAAKVPPVMGLSWPWPKLTELTRGIRRGETIYIGAGVKMGKSELVNAIAEHLITEHKQRVYLVKPEEAMPKSYKMLVGKAAGRIFHDPNMPFDEQAWEQAEPLIGDRAIFCDAYQFVDWNQLKEDILYTVKEDGVQDVMIDPITCLTNQMSAADANEKLTALTAEISAMAKDHNFTAYLYCHLKAPLNGDPHERGGKVLSTQFAGSRAMMRSCNYMMGLRGNKDPELPMEERNMRYLDILEDREFGVSGTVPLYWDNRTSLFNEA
jgi:twinkle protein